VNSGEKASAMRSDAAFSESSFMAAEFDDDKGAFLAST
jgi:hypothetical protein